MKDYKKYYLPSVVPEEIDIPLTNPFTIDLWIADPVKPRIKFSM